MVDVDEEAPPALLPGMPLVLTEAVDWTKCESVVWMSLWPPRAPYTVSIRRVGIERYILLGAEVEVMKVEVSEKSGVTQQWITTVAPFLIVKESSHGGVAEMTRVVRQ